MTELPTKRELKQLIENRGREAVVWYAWRNAMRVLPVLGRKPNKQVWLKQPVKHVYAVIRVNILVFNWLSGGGEGEAGELRQAAAYAVAVAVADVADVAYAAYAAAYGAYAADATDATARAVARAAYAAAAYAAYAAVDDAAAARAAAIADYQFLVNPTNELTDLQHQDLWWGKQPTSVKDFAANFIASLKTMDLDFLARDVRSLWANKLSNKDIQKYLKNISQTELQTATDLKRLLLIEDATQENYAVRALLLGPGGAGKTSLSQLLEFGQIQKNTAPTLGVNYQNHRALDATIHHDLITNPKLSDKLNKLQLYLWDFGGQAIFHSLHNAFMHENCVYIVVVDSRHEQAPDEWLHQIDAVTNNAGKVILVTNWFDGITAQQNQTGLMRKFPGLLNQNSFFNFSCIDGKAAGFKAFVNQLIQDCLASQRLIFKQTQQAFDLIQKQYQKDNFITKGQLKNQLKKHFLIDDDDEVIRLVNKLGEFGRFVSADQHNRQLCLKPEWAIDKAYQLLYHRQVRQQKGQITLDDVAAIIDGKDQELDLKILNFMVCKEVCIELAGDKINNNDKGARYFLPDAAPVNEPGNVRALLDSENRITMIYELPYMPIGLRAKLVSRLMADNKMTVDPNTAVWRDGVIINLCDSDSGSNNDSDNNAVLEYQYRQQRIQLTLIGDDKGKAALLDIVDNELAKAANRALIGYPVYETSGDLSAEGLMPQQLVKQQESLQNIHQYSNCNIITKGDINMGSNTHVGGNVENAAVGAGAKYQSDNTNSHNTDSFNTDSFNTIAQPLSDEQKAAMSEVIKQTIQAVLENPDNGADLTVLANAKQALEQANGQLPEVEDPKANGLLQQMWQGMKELDASASMAERAVKYIAPAVNAAVVYFAG